MQVILGRHMDGHAWPGALEAAEAEGRAVCGVHVTGEAGFLSLLEEKLGLPARVVHGSRRIAVVQQLLRQRTAESPDAFYARAFEADAWNTARRVLAMRDELKMSGALEDAALSAEREDAAPARLAEFFRLEALLGRAGIPGMADRFQRVLRAVDAWGIDGVSRVSLAHPLCCWSAPWKRLFSLLKKNGVEVEETARLAAFAENRLGAAAALLDGAQSKQTAFGNDDDSLMILQADFTTEAAEALASTLARHRHAGDLGRVVMIRADESVELDGALRRCGLPDTGACLRAQGRPFEQILPLYLRLHLFPFDPETLRQFLLLPASPVPKFWAGRFLDALKASESELAWDQEPKSWPGPWRKLWDEAEKLGCGEEKRLRTALSWIVPEGGAAKGMVDPQKARALAQRLGKWAAQAARDDKNSELHMTAELCARLGETVADMREEMSAPEWDKVIDAVLGEGEKRRRTSPGMPWIVLDEPGQLWGGADTVVWWNAVDEGAAPRESVAWSREERAWLETRGFALSDVEAERRFQEEAASRPFFFARRLIMVTPRFRQGEETAPHPLKLRLDAAVESLGIRSPFPEPVSAAEVLAGSDRQKENADTPKEHVDERFGGFWRQEREDLPQLEAALPETDRKRHLQMPESLSPSTLETLLACPLRWYLQYVLHLSDDEESLLPDAVVKGNMAHEAAEQVFREGATPDEETLLALLREQARVRGARMAHPGRSGELRGMAAALHRALSRFMSVADREGYRFHSAEQTAQAKFQDVLLRGRYDLAFARAGEASPSLIVDMKWSRRSAYRKSVDEGMAAQLAAYQYLLKHGAENGERAADVRDAWYVLLPLADIVRVGDSAAEPDLEKQWDKVAEALEATLSAMREGVLAVHEEQKQDSTCTYCAFRFLCGRRDGVKRDAAEEEASV
ncbi:PD-(D/E)XK nuclease family protein [uncultured Mailhella sp.]|uniref:PD-(D/E)XK nuclease family protein n=1 Tax=uncultured Mailhella sp. TaxID=1981031 RepID=UPI0025CC7202|nr:PD-(D/E)XK nuclease family protein [uncultured Mailhella sp.]